VKPQNSSKWRDFVVVVVLALYDLIALLLYCYNMCNEKIVTDKICHAKIKISIFKCVLLLRLCYL
jgi:hypothetical protein